MEACCFLCRTFHDNSFYLCPKSHILCHNCCKINIKQNIRLCTICDKNMIRCVIKYENQNSRNEELLSNKIYESGPVILLPADVLDEPGCVHNNPGCETAKHPGHCRLTRCVSCCKCLSSTRIREHYCHEHHSLFICPLPPGGTISFLMNYDDVKLFEFKNLQIISTKYSGDGEQDEKMFSVMATKVPYMVPSYYDSYHVILVWLYSLSHACYVTYTIEAITQINKGPTVSFTGQPMDSNFMEYIIKGKSTVEDFGQFLILKKSFFNLSKQCESGTIINVSIHKC